MDVADIAVRDIDPGRLARWRELAGSALEPNPFFEPESVLAAARHLPGGDADRLLAAEDGGALAAVVPVRPRRSYRRIPVPALQAWGHDHCYLETPLVRGDAPEEALGAVIDHLRDQRSAPWLVMETARAGGPVREALDRALAQRGLRALGMLPFERPMIRRRPEPTYLDGRLSSRRRKELRRSRRRLASALGEDVATVGLAQDAGDLDAALDDFLRLEASGWKGRAGTALACRPGDAAFFRETMHAYARDGRARVWTLRGAGRVAAIACAVIAGDTLFHLKIAHDHALARASPGTLLELDLIDAFHAEQDAAWLDPCTPAGPSPSARLYPDARAMETLLVALTPVRGVAAAGAARRVVAARRALAEAEAGRRERAGRPAEVASVAAGIEVVRALGAVGVRSRVVADHDDMTATSRFADAHVTTDGRTIPDALLEDARDAGGPLALLYDNDAALLAISRARDALARAGYRFLLPEVELIEDLADKARFQELAERLELGVPRAVRVRPADCSASDLDLPFPLILKAVPYRDARWDRIGEEAKALAVDDAEQLRRLWPRLADAELDLLAQEAVPGTEREVVSYHVYVDSDGTVAGEFTGRKIRTYPGELGMSTALVTTDDPQVLSAGRETVERLGLRGPAKIDFKRTPGGELRLFEVNPRLTLWVLPGAAAGVNLAAIAYADALGRPRPPRATARAGVRWISPRLDLKAAREEGLSVPRWLWFAARSDTNPALAWNDLSPLATRALRRSRAARGEPGRSGIRPGGR